MRLAFLALLVVACGGGEFSEESAAGAPSSGGASGASPAGGAAGSQSAGAAGLLSAGSSGRAGSGGSLQTGGVSSGGGGVSGAGTAGSSGGGAGGATCSPDLCDSNATATPACAGAFTSAGSSCWALEAPQGMAKLILVTGSNVTFAWQEYCGCEKPTGEELLANEGDSIVIGAMGGCVLLVHFTSAEPAELRYCDTLQ